MTQRTGHRLLGQGMCWYAALLRLAIRSVRSFFSSAPYPPRLRAHDASPARSPFLCCAQFTLNTCGRHRSRTTFRVISRGFNVSTLITGPYRSPSGAGMSDCEIPGRRAPMSTQTCNLSKTSARMTSSIGEAEVSKEHVVMIDLRR